MADLVVSIAEWWQVVRFPLGAALCLGGALLCVVGTVGVLRFPDFYTRLHAAINLLSTHWLQYPIYRCHFQIDRHDHLRP